MIMINKIFSKKQLEKKLDKIRLKKKLVLCHGVFDLVHLGHIKHFQAAKKLGDFLIISITKDKFVNKSINGTFFKESERLEHLSNLEIVDAVVLSDEKSSIDIIKIVKPHYYVKGIDYKDNKKDDTKKIYLEKKLVQKFGGKIYYTNEVTFSSSSIKNKKNINLSDEQRSYIDQVKKKLSFNSFFKILESKKNINVTVLGELIFDKYQFGDAVGKSGKEPHLVLNKKNEELLLGGSGAIARNLASFVKNINLISFYGFEKKYDLFLKQSLKKNAKKYLFKPYADFKSIVKTRYIDRVSNYKLFGAYDVPSTEEFIYSKKIINNIKKILLKTDLLIISDYGHGLLNDQLIKLINSVKTFKSLNVQVNSSSRGFSSLHKYKNIDLLLVNENELRQELKNYKSDLDVLLKKLMKLYSFKNLTVTSGKVGAKLYTRTKKNSIINCPAFSNYTVDKIGAGDSMLTLMSFLIFSKIDKFFSLLVGSLAAAITVKGIGNKNIVDKESLLRYIKFLFK